MIREFGLIGFPLSHSFSKRYFAEKFAKEAILQTTYENYPLSEIGMLPDLLQMNADLVGLNVTIPYKTGVINYLDELADDAREINAVNTIKRYPDGTLKGFNSDIYGFGETLHRFVDDLGGIRVLILGTGGSSKAVEYVCRKRGYGIQFVSRRRSDHAMSYDQLSQEIVHEHQLIVNTTPLGMHPNVEDFPTIPYEFLRPDHRLLDLIYNPAETTFLRKGAEQGCQVKNGLEMLILQAEKSWEIWNNPDC
jgi:shikimate dehydrogenase